MDAREQQPGRLGSRTPLALAAQPRRQLGQRTGPLQLASAQLLEGELVAGMGERGAALPITSRLCRRHRGGLRKRPACRGGRTRARQRPVIVRLRARLRRSEHARERNAERGGRGGAKQQGKRTGRPHP